MSNRTDRISPLTPPTAYTSGHFGFTYDALSRRTQMTRPNSVTTNYTYDTLSRLLSVNHVSGRTTLDGVTYTVNAAGNRLTRTPSSGSASTFTYDSLYQLTKVVQGKSTTTETYSYDPVGNRLSALNSSGWSNKISNELTSRPGVTYTYDNNGNLLTKADSTGTTRYVWDFENRLSSVTLPGSGGTVSFKYDPFGRRIYKSSSTATSIYAYDGDNLIEEANSSGAVVARYSQGLSIDEPLALLRSSSTSYYQADGLGSVTSLTSSAGAVANTYTYDTFGNLTASTGNLVNPFRYTARESYPETGLYFYRARYYDTSTGRFWNEDPIQFVGGDADLYRFVGNGPTNVVDPFGLKTAVPSIPWPRVLPYPIVSPWARAIGGLIGAALSELLDPGATARDEDLLRDLPKPAQTCPRQNDPCKGLRDILREHMQKLFDYGSNPAGQDNEGILGKGRDEQIIAGRMKNLINQIRNFTRLLRECEARNGNK